MKFVSKLILLLLCAVVLSSCNQSIEPDPGLSKVVSQMDEENPEFSFGEGEDAYKMGYNKDGMLIFVDMNKALDQLCIDYADVIEAIKEEYDLEEISPSNWWGYGVYGWQLNSDDAQLCAGGVEVTGFFDYYDNGFTIDQKMEMMK